MTRILLVEDDKSLGATLRDCLAGEGYQVVWAQSKAASLQENEKQNFDLYLLDVGLPDGTGFEIAKAFDQGPNKKPFIFLTAQSDAESRLQGYELGAEEYIPKPFHLKELLLRVKHVLDNHVPIAGVSFAGINIDFAGFTIEVAGQRQTIPSKDMLFLKLLVEQSPRVVSRDEALNLLWGEDKFPSARTVDNCVLRLRAVLGEKGSEHIESVRGVGYRWNAPERKS